MDRHVSAVPAVDLLPLPFRPPLPLEQPERPRAVVLDALAAAGSPATPTPHPACRLLHPPCTSALAAAAAARCRIEGKSERLAIGWKNCVWFALDEDMLLFAFAGIWCNWVGVHGTKKALADGEHTLYGLLTLLPGRLGTTNPTPPVRSA